MHTTDVATACYISYILAIPLAQLLYYISLLDVKYVQVYS